MSIKLSKDLYNKRYSKIKAPKINQNLSVGLPFTACPCYLPWAARWCECVVGSTGDGRGMTSENLERASCCSCIACAETLATSARRAMSAAGGFGSVATEDGGSEVLLSSPSVLMPISKPGSAACWQIIASTAGGCSPDATTLSPAAVKLSYAPITTYGSLLSVWGFCRSGYTFLRVTTRGS